MSESPRAGRLRALARHEEVRRIVKFGVVGFSGVFVNLAVSEFFFRVALVGIGAETRRLAIANTIGVIVSIFTNFMLNDRWTWGDRSKGEFKDWLVRLGKYYVLASVAGVVQIAVSSYSFDIFWSLLPVEIFGVSLDSTLAICTGIGAGMVINFVASHFWAFRDVEEE